MNQNKKRKLSQRIDQPASALVDPKKEFSDPPAFRLAFSDMDFLLREENRGIRVQLELIKADTILHEHKINSTAVIFGSARISSQEEARTALTKAQKALSNRPENPELIQAVKQAERALADSHYYEEARELAHIIGQHERQAPEDQKLYVCTGGGPGIMEAANRGASESGSPNIGFNIVLPHKQNANPYITPELCFRFHYFATRKMHFMMRAKALIAFPGGFGTLDELFETLTLIQTHKTSPVPIILYGSEFWERLIHFDILVEMGTISASDLKLFKYADTPQQAWESICEHYILT